LPGRVFLFLSLAHSLRSLWFWGSMQTISFVPTLSIGPTHLRRSARSFAPFSLLPTPKAEIGLHQSISFWYPSHQERSCRVSPSTHFFLSPSANGDPFYLTREPGTEFPKMNVVGSLRIPFPPFPWCCNVSATSLLDFLSWLRSSCFLCSLELSRGSSFSLE